MDSRITKKRLSVLLSYQWIIIAIVSVVAIALWGFIYGIVVVKPTTGQVFNYYYDMNVSNQNDQAFLMLLEDKNVFSYDIREIGSEYITERKVLTARCAEKEADAIITTMYGEQKDGYISCRANEIVDSFSVYALDDQEGGILFDAIEYLKGFLSDKNLDPLNFENLDKSLIKANFDERIAQKRIYRNMARAGEIIVEQEYQRIEKLCEEVSFFKKVLEYDASLSAEDSIFYRMTKYEMAYKEANSVDLENYKALFEQETERAYGLKTIKLKSQNANKAVGDYFKMVDGQQDYSVIEIFNFSNTHRDLQFESISFLNMIIRNFSDIATKIA